MKKTGNKRKPVAVLATVLTLMASTAAWAQEVVVPNSFQAGQPAVADEVNENFTTLADAVNEARLEAFYGDGSEGDLDIPGVQSFMPVESTRFANCTIQAGHTLTIFSGTLIRCRGDFVNNGTINVQTYTRGGGSFTTSNRFRPAHPGQGQSAAMLPGLKEASSFSHGAFGGQGIITPNAVAHVLHWGAVGGGSGSGGNSTGGAGGGTLTVITAGRFINNGVIDASGEDGSPGFGAGGGGGGIVVIASAISYTNNGTIDVSGGDGGTPNVSGGGQPAGPGGGGGGGLIRVVAPADFTAGGTRFTNGGLAGDISGGTVVANPALLAFGGGGGGGSYGSGGAGGNVNSGAVSTAFNGTNGAFFATNTDPTAFF